MRLLILFLFVIMTSCTHWYRNDQSLKQKYEHSTTHEDTLVCQHHECTECLDLYIKSGKLTVPSEFKRQVCNDSSCDIMVCGNFPLDLIDMTAINFKSGEVFQITGKVISLDSINGKSEVPLFYVSTWRVFHKTD